MNRLHTLMVATTISIAPLMSGCSSAEQVNDGKKHSTTITVIAAEDRKPAPVLDGVDLDGNKLSTASYEGKVLVVNLWGPWCPPCRAEAPVLKKVSEDYAAENVQFVGIVNDSDSARAARFNVKAGIGYPSFADQGGRLEVAFAKSLPTQTVPTTWIIDAQGRVAVRIVEPKLTEATLAGLIDDVQQDAA